MTTPDVEVLQARIQKLNDCVWDGWQETRSASPFATARVACASNWVWTQEGIRFSPRTTHPVQLDRNCHDIAPVSCGLAKASGSRRTAGPKARSSQPPATVSDPVGTTGPHRPLLFL